MFVSSSIFHHFVRVRPLQCCLSGALFALLCACNGPKPARPAAAAPQAPAKADVVLAVVPLAESMPILYARDAGLFEKAGLCVAVEVYEAQADCDSAVLGHADGGYLDGYSRSSARLGGALVRVATLSGGGWGIVVSPAMRSKSVADLKERVVASARAEASAHYLDAALAAGGKLKASQVMMPHVGSFRTRTSMVANNQVEAAILPQPYLSAAAARGCKRLYVLPAATEGGASLAIKPGRCNAERQKSLRAVYAQAIDSLHQHGKRLLPPLLTRYAGIPQAVADTMRLPQYVRPKTR